jgi:hypothetical protein
MALGGRAHAERFAQVRAARNFVEVARFIEPDWLVELEVDAIVLEGSGGGTGPARAGTEVAGV